jgi:hypothetical protein
MCFACPHTIPKAQESRETMRLAYGHGSAAAKLRDSVNELRTKEFFR